MQNNNEQSDFTSKNKYGRKYISSQRIVGSNKEMFIINYEGAILEIHRTNNLYEPLIVQINGELVETVPSTQKKEIFFTTSDNVQHKLEVWNERIDNSPLLKFFLKDGIALVIDGIYVKNTLADPVLNLRIPQIYLWLLTAFIFIVNIFFPLLNYSNGYVEKLSLGFYISLVAITLLLYASLRFKFNPITSVWLGIIIGWFDFTVNIFYLILFGGFNLLFIASLILRFHIITKLSFSLKQIHSILDTDFNPSNIKGKRKIAIPSRKTIITYSSFIIIIIALYFITDLNSSSGSEVKVERHSSISIRNDLTLPPLIPYRHNNKWGLMNNNKEIIIKTEYEEVRFADDSSKYLVKKNGLNYLINEKNEHITPADYDIELDNGIILSQKNGLWGVLSRENVNIIPHVYNSLHFNENNTFIANRNKYGVIDLNNKTIVPFEYTYIEYFHNNYIVTKSTSYEGLFSSTGKETIPVSRQNIRPITEKSKLLGVNKHPSGIYRTQIVNTNGEIVTPLNYYNNLSSVLSRFGFENHCIFTIYDYGSDKVLSGILDYNANLIIPALYDEINIISEKYNYFIVTKNYLKGIVNHKNEILLPIIYDNLGYFEFDNDPYFIATINHNTGVINKTGEAIIPLKYKKIAFNESHNFFDIQGDTLFTVLTHGHFPSFGIMNLKNEIVFPVKYNTPVVFSEDLAAVGIVIDTVNISEILFSSHKYEEQSIKDIFIGLIGGLADNQGFVKEKTGFNLSYEVFKSLLSDPIKRVRFYNEYKNYLPGFQSYESFALTIVLGFYYEYRFPKKWGYVDKNGNVIIDFNYDYASSFENGLALVEFNGKRGIINKKNQVVIPIKYDKITRVDDYDLFKISLEGKEGYVDLNAFEYFLDD